jgi:hypothetical protein
LEPVTRPEPQLGVEPLAVSIGGPSVPPRTYVRHSHDFRYWTAAEALRRGAEYWSGIVPSGTTWERGSPLVANLEAGEELNAYYDREGLSFFHKRVGRYTIYSGESPDVVCHELGHAVLDALKPELFDTASVEVAAFHESFGDCSALLSALQLPTVRDGLLEETEGQLYKTSRVSRLAEQLATGIRRSRPDLVEPDCLRNAVNSFVYQVPEDLPHSAPSWMLSSEPHSFSRVFTAGFFEALAKMLALTGDAPTGDDLLAVAQDAGRLLVAGTVAASVVPDFYSQVAANMVQADDELFRRKYGDSLKSAFVRRGILSLDSLQLLGSSPQRRRRAGRPAGVAASMDVGGNGPLPMVSIRAARFGLGDQALAVVAPTGTKLLDVRGAAFMLGPVASPPAEEATKSFVEDLFKRGRVDIQEFGDAHTRLVHPGVRKTHEIASGKDGLLLVRRAFDCGFGYD